MSQDHQKSHPPSIEELMNKTRGADDKAFDFDDLDPATPSNPNATNVDPLDDDDFFAQLDKANHAHDTADLGADLDFGASATPSHTGTADSLMSEFSAEAHAAPPSAHSPTSAQSDDVGIHAPQNLQGAQSFDALSHDPNLSHSTYTPGGDLDAKMDAQVDAKDISVTALGAAGATLASKAKSNKTAKPKKPLFGGLFTKKPKLVDTGLEPLSKTTGSKANLSNDIFADTNAAVNDNANGAPKDANQGNIKNSLLVKKPKAPKGDAGNSNLLKYIVLAALAAILLLVLAYWLNNQGNTPTPAPAPAPVVQPAPEPTPEAAPQSEDATSFLPQGEAEQIDVDAILNAEVPQDETLIKEEIDRLHDKDTQLAEQAKILDEQLGGIEKLSQAQEEQIKLLEEQIKLLEAQKQK